MGWKGRVGAFDVGKEWDAQFIQLDDVPEEGEEMRNRLGEENVKVFGWEYMEDGGC